MEQSLVSNPRARTGNTILVLFPGQCRQRKQSEHILKVALRSTNSTTATSQLRRLKRKRQPFLPELTVAQRRTSQLVPPLLGPMVGAVIQAPGCFLRAAVTIASSACPMASVTSLHSLYLRGAHRPPPWSALPFFNLNHIRSWCRQGFCEREHRDRGDETSSRVLGRSVDLPNWNAETE